jgi:DNA polymerase-4
VQPLIDERGLTLVGIALTNLENDLPYQLELPFVPDPSESLDAAIDQIKDRFGTYALTRGVTLGRSDLTMPLLPD